MFFIIPLFILGLLQRFGPQHGYQIKKIIADQLADFTQIKLPTIYYHLEKMQTEGLLSVSSEKLGSRPEKSVYAVTQKGIRKFKELLTGLLDFEYEPAFPSDAVFYFSHYLEPREISEHLTAYIERLRIKLSYIDQHRKETLGFVPDSMKAMVIIIFSHHERHFRAELDWALETAGALTIRE